MRVDFGKPVNGLSYTVAGVNTRSPASAKGALQTLVGIEDIPSGAIPRSHLSSGRSHDDGMEL